MGSIPASRTKVLSVTTNGPESDFQAVFLWFLHTSSAKERYASSRRTAPTNSSQPSQRFLLVQVRGNMVSNTSAAFGGAVMLAPVPEPETYGMMLGGLGILGLLARRRRPVRQA